MMKSSLIWSCIGVALGDSTEDCAAMQHSHMDASLLVTSSTAEQVLSHYLSELQKTAKLDATAMASIQKAILSGDGPTMQSVIEDLTGLVVPLLDAGHSSDQTLLDDAEKVMIDCDSTRASLDGEVNNLWQAFESSKSTHEGCRARFAGTTTDMNNKCGDATNYYNTLSGIPDCSKPTNQASLLNFLETNKNWYTQHYPIFKNKEELCAAAQGLDARTSTECNGDQAQAEGDYCGWYHTQWTQWTTYHNCYDSAMNPTNGYPAVKSSVEGREQSRQKQFEVFEKVKCILNDVLSQNTSVITAPILQGAADACNQQVVDQTAYTITYDSPIAREEHTYNVNAPGDGAWAVEYYGTMSNVNPSVVKCYRGKQATTTTTTQSAPASSWPAMWEGQSSLSSFTKGKLHLFGDDTQCWSKWPFCDEGRGGGNCGLDTPPTAGNHIWKNDCDNALEFDYRDGLLTAQGPNGEELCLEFDNNINFRRSGCRPVYFKDKVVDPLTGKAWFRVGSGDFCVQQYVARDDYDIDYCGGANADEEELLKRCTNHHGAGYGNHCFLVGVEA